MPTEQSTCTTAILQRLESLLQQEPDFRDHCRSFAHCVLNLTDSVPNPTGGPAENSPDALPTQRLGVETPGLHEPIATELSVEVEVVPPSPLVAAVNTETQSFESSQYLDVTDADLPMIQERLVLKAEASRWAASRRRLLANGADMRIDIAPSDKDLIARAKELEDCYLWMSRPTGPNPNDLELFDDMGGCFEATANAVGLIHSFIEADEVGSEDFLQGLALLAEAQSALRAAVSSLTSRTELDQKRVYLWLRATAYDAKIYLPHFLKLDDNADPMAWGGLCTRIENLQTAITHRLERVTQHQANLNRIRFHLKSISQHPGENRGHDWNLVVQTVNEMVEGGLPPSNVDIRELLLPVADDLPIEGLPEAFVRVMREIDRYLASRPPVQDSKSSSNLSPAVKHVAKTLKDTTLVVIGGERRQYSCDALNRAFGLGSVDWVTAPPHESPTVFEPHIADPSVKVVVLAIRWSSHGFGDVDRYCEKYGKCFVRLTGGYNPNQVAVQIVNQCGKRLKIGE